MFVCWKLKEGYFSFTPNGCRNVDGGEEKCLASQGWKWPKGHLSSRGRIFLEKLLPHCYCSLTPCFETNKTQKTPLIWLMQVILWTLDNGNTINSLELDNSNSECYYFERLERVLATQVSFSYPDSILLSNPLSQNIFQSWCHLMTFLSVDGEATVEGSQAEAEIWSAEVQKLHRTLFRGQHVHLQGSKHKKMRKYDNATSFWSGILQWQGGSEKEIYAPEEGADTGLFASVLQVFFSVRHSFASELNTNVSMMGITFRNHSLSSQHNLKHGYISTFMLFWKDCWILTVEFLCRLIKTTGFYARHQTIGFSQSFGGLHRWNVFSKEVLHS